MSYGYEIKFWNRALTDEEVIKECLISINEGELQFNTPLTESEPSSETEGIVYINGPDSNGNITIEAEGATVIHNP